MNVKDAFIRIGNRFALNNRICTDVHKALLIRSALHQGKGNIIKRMLLRRKYNKICFRYGCFLPASTEIGNNISFPHGLYGIFISQNAKIGDNCCIFHQVTIGSNTLNDSQGAGAPQIGNEVYIGAGAKIIGNCKIGNNVRIGANTVVTKDVPDNTTVVGQGNRVIQHDGNLDNSFHTIE